MNEINFKHRLNGYQNSSCGLFDAVNAMSGRATAILIMIQSDFVIDDERLCDEIILNALEAVACEINDIKEIVNQYHQHVRKVANNG